ncbi:putative bifunctional diguanylate cyclase/phosphodiesterase [Vibrio cyclitrophicus]|uniref:putative bifunctional diguanylate cyclase/phosphodiesterase n=1 Tax=Vibrio cyclitrophicus TaxID=47951 RepID=UPI0021C3FF0F|nr:GGDEF domain-containing phosphodiesterase [Vibrio cyclitrophicus]
MKPTKPNHNSDEHHFIQLLDTLPKVSVQGYDVHRRVIYWNKASTVIYGYDRSEALGHRLEDLIIPDEMRDEVIQHHQTWIKQGIPIPSSELMLRHKAGHLVPVFSAHVMLKQHTNSPEMFCVDIDLSEQYAARKELKVLAVTDPLTSLPNRRGLERELDIRIAQAHSLNQSFAVLFIDLDNFKDINDTFGHVWGDRLLLSVAKRLKTTIRKEDFLARFAGDEFILFIHSIECTDDVHIFANKAVRAFSRSFALYDEHVFLTASVGISVYPRDGGNKETLLKHADIAMYQAKKAGRNRYEFYTSSLSQALQQQWTLSSQLRDSLLSDEFKLVYQPQFDFQTGQLISCEALLRWAPSESNRAVSPDIFIPIAERSDLILLIGEWVLKHACIQAKKWKKAGVNIRIDINVSGKQLEHIHFLNQLEAYRDKYGLAASDLGIELTEHTLIESPDWLIETLNTQKEQGMNIALDDFGTGYSSLSYLKNFPITHLKIDRSFITLAPEHDLDAALVQAMVNIGHQLNLTIVAEGVETPSQSQFCQALNIDVVQGYLYAKPMPAEQILAYTTQAIRLR